MRAPRWLPAAAASAALFLLAACGAADRAAPAPTPRPAAEVTAAASRPAAAATPPSTPRPQPTPPSTRPVDPTASAALTPPAGSRFEPAPIDGAEILVQESSPVQYAVRITSGLPSGCHAFDHTTLARAGSEITIDVVNRLPADSRVACTAIYGMHDTTVPLGADFASGATYRVRVNDRALEFTAQ